jgi:hypothetical protein
MALEGGEESVSRPGRFNPGKDPLPIVQEAGWAPGPVWTDTKNLAPQPGFDPGIVHPVASHYIDWAIPAHVQDNIKGIESNVRPTQPHN